MPGPRPLALGAGCATSAWCKALANWRALHQDQLLTKQHNPQRPRTATNRHKRWDAWPMQPPEFPTPGSAPDLTEYDVMSYDALEWLLSDHPWAKAERQRRRETHFANEQQLATKVQAWTDKIDRLQPGSTTPEFEQTARRLAATLRPQANASQLRTQDQSAKPDELTVEEERHRLVLRRRNEGDDAYEYPPYLTGPAAARYPPPTSGFRPAK